MRSKFLLACLAFVCTTCLFAQKNTPAKSSPTTLNNTTTNLSLGQLIAQLTGHINPSSLTPDFEKNKTGWLYKANRSKNMVSLSWFVQSLQAGLSNTAYTDEWLSVRDKWLADSKAINTAKQAANLIKTLEANLQKNTFDKTWGKDKKAWESAINTAGG